MPTTTLISQRYTYSVFCGSCFLACPCCHGKTGSVRGRCYSRWAYIFLLMRIAVVGLSGQAEMPASHAESQGSGCLKGAWKDRWCAERSRKFVVRVDLVLVGKGAFVCIVENNHSSAESATQQAGVSEYFETFSRSSGHTRLPLTQETDEIEIHSPSLTRRSARGAQTEPQAPNRVNGAKPRRLTPQDFSKVVTGLVCQAPPQPQGTKWWPGALGRTGPCKPHMPFCCCKLLW